MPKNKKKASTSSHSDSDSGPEDRNPPPTKKSKSTEKSDSKNEEANSWTLEKLRTVKVREFRGKKMVDIREYYEKNAEILPGKKGIALTPLQWKKLLEVADEINTALNQ